MHYARRRIAPCYLPARDDEDDEASVAAAEGLTPTREALMTRAGSAVQGFVQNRHVSGKFGLVIVHDLPAGHALVPPPGDAQRMSNLPRRSSPHPSLHPRMLKFPLSCRQHSVPAGQSLLLSQSTVRLPEPPGSQLVLKPRGVLTSPSGKPTLQQLFGPISPFTPLQLTTGRLHDPDPSHRDAVWQSTDPLALLQPGIPKI